MISIVTPSFGNSLSQYGAKLAAWCWGGFFYVDVPNALFSIGVRKPEQNRYGHFTGIRGWLFKLSFRLGFHEYNGWECYLHWC
jgi:hypothetical protein